MVQRKFFGTLFCELWLLHSLQKNRWWQGKFYRVCMVSHSLLIPSLYPPTRAKAQSYQYVALGIVLFNTQFRINHWKPQTLPCSYNMVNGIFMSSVFNYCALFYTVPPRKCFPVWIKNFFVCTAL